MAPLLVAAEASTIQERERKKLERKTPNEESVTKMSVEESEPPQYIVTAPGEEKNDDDDDRSSTTTTASTATAQSTGTAINVKTTKAHNTRSQSLQSSSTAVVVGGGDQSSTLTASLMQQLKAQSTVNIVTEKHVQKFSSSQTTTSSSSSSASAVATGTKSKFTSFLQHPDASSHGANFLTAQQKHVRQFVRSTSAHSSTDSNATGISISGKSDKCIRSTSQQIDDDPLSGFNTDYAKGLHQSAAILISKSAETIERSVSTSSTTMMRPQLTLSGGFLAPPANRKLTILSPVHAPPGLQEMLKKHRSPLSPRISFPGPDADLFP